MKRKKREDIYHIRIWRDGILIKQLGPLSRREAAKAWKAWEELAGTRGQLEEARQAGEQQLARAAEMEKKLAVAGDKEMVEFNILFRRAQEEMVRLHQKYLAITANDQEKATAIRTAVGRMIQMMARKWE